MNLTRLSNLHNNRRYRARRLLPRLVALIGLSVACAAPVQAQDLAISSVLQPVSGCALSNAENVTMRIFNYGPTLSAGTSILVAYTINGGSNNNDTVTLASSLLSNSYLDFTFTAQANLSAAGSYAFNFAINPAGDINPGNNALNNHVVNNSAPSVAGSVNGTSVGSAGALMLSGEVGAVVQWEESPDGQRWFKLANTSNTQNFSALTVPTQFRVRVANAPCAAATSIAHAVTP